jgi:hypothetical protein
MSTRNPIEAATGSEGAPKIPPERLADPTRIRREIPYTNATMDGTMRAGIPDISRFAVGEKMT